MTSSPLRQVVWHPAVILASGFATSGFAAIIVVGAIALAFPIAQAEGRWTPFLDALFTATSAVCVTGLLVVDTGTYWDTNSPRINWRIPG